MYWKYAFKSIDQYGCMSLVIVWSLLSISVISAGQQTILHKYCWDLAYQTWLGVSGENQHTSLGFNLKKVVLGVGVGAVIQIGP